MKRAKYGREWGWALLVSNPHYCCGSMGRAQNTIHISWLFHSFLLTVSASYMVSLSLSFFLLFADYDFAYSVAADVKLIICELKWTKLRKRIRHVIMSDFLLVKKLWATLWERPELNWTDTTEQNEPSCREEGWILMLMLKSWWYDLYIWRFTQSRSHSRRRRRDQKDGDVDDTECWRSSSSSSLKATPPQSTAIIKLLLIRNSYFAIAKGESFNAELEKGARDVFAF